MRSDLLNGTRVIDLATASSWDCGRFLASLGAEVVRVDLPDAEFDQAWRIGNADKTCVAVDYRTEAGRSELRDLIGIADMVVESFAPGHLDQIGFGVPALHEDNPDLVVVSITPFGQTGPRAGFKGGELVTAALSGVMSVNGHPDRWPLKEAGGALSFHASMAGAMGGVFALHNARRGGGGQQVDISAQELGASRNTVWTLIHQFDGLRGERGGAFMNTGRGSARAIFQIKDGHAVLPMGGPAAPTSLAIGEWMAATGLENPLAGLSPQALAAPDPGLVTRWRAALETFLGDRTREELMTEGLKRKAYILPLNRPRDLMDDPHFRARGFMGPAEGGGDLKLPQWFVRTTGMDTGPPRLPETPTPLAEAALTPHVARPVSPSDRALPLAGVRVLDFSWAIVGNTAAKMLGDLGAQVVKVETGRRLALERISIPARNVPAEGAPNNNPWFAHIATSKLSLTLDMGNPASRPVADALVDWADIVFENFSPGVMGRLGMDYETLKARKPSIVMGSGSIFGQSGPLSPLPGTESTGSAFSGRLAMNGDADRGPCAPSTTYGDSVTPFLLATAMIAALERRDRTGEGCWVDGSMAEILTQQMLPELVAAQTSLANGGDGEVARLGNRHPQAAPHNTFPCAGDDAWVAITVMTDGEFTALAQVMGQPGLAQDPRFRSAKDRKANEAELEAIVATYTGRLTPWEAMDQLQAAGVPAGAVQAAGDIADRDPQIAHRGFLTPVEHAVLGTFPHQRTPLTFTRTPPRMFPAPRMGEHSRQIVVDLLGFSPAEFDELSAKGAFQ